MPSTMSSLLSDTDPFVLFEQMGVTDAAHAFYLGYEMMKARTALTLSKTYRQDRAMDWGFLTEPEVSHIAQAAADDEQSGGRPGRPRMKPRTRHSARSRRDTRGHRDDAERRGVLNIAPMGPEVDPAAEPGAIRASPVPDLDHVRQPESAGRGGLSRHRRRAAPGPDGDRGGRSTRFRATRPARCGGRRDPVDACRYYEFRVVELDDRDDRTTDRGRKPSLRDAIATSSASTGRSMRSSRRPSWRHATAGCRSTRCCSISASWRCWSTRPAGPASARPSRCCTTTSTRPPSIRALTPT